MRSSPLPLGTRSAAAIWLPSESLATVHRGVFRLQISIFSLVLGLVMAGVPTQLRAQSPHYAITILGSLVIGSQDVTQGINSSGQIVGASSGNTVIWTGATPQNLGSIDGVGSLGCAINDFGQVAGSYNLTTATYHAVRWTGTTPTDLGTLGGIDSSGYGINASGQVVGTADLSNGAQHAVVWNGTTPTDLGALSANSSTAFGINDSGQIAGEFSNSISSNAVRWDGVTTPTMLGALGGQNSVGYNINASGQVVGSAQLANGDMHAVVWTGTTPTDLGTLGGSNSFAYGINDQGEAVGMSQTIVGNTSSDAFLYDNGTMYDLNSLLVSGSGVTSVSIFAESNCINDAGQISAFGIVNGQAHGLLLTPTTVPEPSSAVSLTFGAVWLLCRRRRREINVS